MNNTQMAIASLLLLAQLGCTDDSGDPRSQRLSSSEFRRLLPSLVERAKKTRSPNSKYLFELVEVRVEQSYVADLTFLHNQTPSWESLVIRSNDVGLNTAEFETLKSIANLKSLQVPYISGTAFRRLHELPEIEEFSLSNAGSFLNHINSLKLQIERLPLKHLSISHCHGLSGSGEIFPLRLPNLESLDLDYTDISDEDLLHLATLPKLKRLNLAGTHISVSGLQNLFHSKSLEHVNARHTEVVFGEIRNVPFQLLIDEKN